MAGRSGHTATFFIPGHTMDTYPVELPVSWSLDDYPQFEYLRTDIGTLPGLRGPASVFGNFLDDIDYMLRDVPRGRR
ncbi:hypothetical protein [Nonomuraea jiangxiensis]|uniref:hypothetical protein n=1 Tax=Nonomuraea jiangxiensis TaxID=633440 RepID=UPI000B85FF4B|nr:hypothetical protein [Nonomuraea jiangxiensis]